MRVDTLHMTMAFLGETSESRLASLDEIGAVCARAAHPFEMSLDHLGYWPRKHLVWVGPGSVPRALADLAGALATRLGDVLQDRRFNPHITLVRKAGAWPEVPAPKLSWPVDTLCLVRSVTSPTGAQYVTIGRWPLGK